MWISRVKCTFQLKQVEGEATKFFYLMQILHRETMKLVGDFVEKVPKEQQKNTEVRFFCAPESFGINFFDLLRS